MSSPREDKLHYIAPIVASLMTSWLKSSQCRPIMLLYWVSLTARMGILNYEVDTIQQLETTPGPTLPPLGELTFNSIRLVYPHLFEGLGELEIPIC